MGPLYLIHDEQGKEAEDEINKIGPGEATFIFADVTKEEDIQNLIKRTIDKYGRIDCVINNAGWHPPYTRIDHYTGDDLRYLLNLNVVGYFLVCKYALPHLRKTEGNIINNSSIGAHFGDAWSVGYDTSKGAVSSMTKALAIDEAKHNVRVNAISPGSIITPLAEEFLKNTPNPEATRQIFQDISLLGRQGTPEEVGLTCLYLATDATFCTGIDILITGGTSLNYGIKNMRLTDVWPTSFSEVL